MRGEGAHAGGSSQHHLQRRRDTHAQQHSRCPAASSTIGIRAFCSADGTLHSKQDRMLRCGPGALGDAAGPAENAHLVCRAAAPCLRTDHQTPRALPGPG